MNEQETPEQKTPEAVSTAAVWPGPLSTVPAGTAVPREGAAGAAALGAALLADVEAYREQVRPCVEAGQVPASAFEDVAALRRGVATVADLLSARGLPAASAEQAVRVAERVTGLVARLDEVAATEALGLDTQVRRRCAAMADANDEEFAAALLAARAAGAMDVVTVYTALRANDTPTAVRQQWQTLARLIAQGMSVAESAATLGVTERYVVDLAERGGVVLPQPDVPPVAVDLAEVVPPLIEALAALGKQVEHGAASLGEVPPEVAADWSRELWGVLVPLVGFRSAVDKHARKL